MKTVCIFEWPARWLLADPEDGSLARIVVAASPMSGHVLPLVMIAGHLHREGHDVLVLTGEDHADLAARYGLAFTPLPPEAHPEPPSAVSVVNRMLPNLVRRYLLGVADMRKTFIAPLVAQYTALSDVLAAAPADVVVADVAFTGALPLVSGGGARPRVLVCGVGPLTLSSADTAPFGMAWLPHPAMNYGDMHAVVNRVLLRGVQDELNEALRRVGAGRIDVPLTDWPRLADRMLQLAVPDFEYPRRDLPATVDYIGPVLPEGNNDFEPPPWWGEVLRAQTVVHVTQGTHDNGDLDQLIGTTVRALADADGVVVVATAGRREGRPLLSDLPANAFVAEWLPYPHLLPHVDVMITNGGFGGVQHALRHGIPVVVAGETSDKAEVAARVEYAGVGVNLKTAHPSPRAIAAAVAEAEGCRAAARRLGRTMARATPLDAIAELVAQTVTDSAGTFAREV